jgi:hypothetical protein
MVRRISGFITATWLAGIAGLVMTSLTAGCERKERVLDVRTPAGDVTVDRNIDNGRVDVKTRDK